MSWIFYLSKLSPYVHFSGSVRVCVGLCIYSRWGSRVAVVDRSSDCWADCGAQREWLAILSYSPNRIFEFAIFKILYLFFSFPSFLPPYFPLFFPLSLIHTPYSFLPLWFVHRLFLHITSVILSLCQPDQAIASCFFVVCVCVFIKNIFSLYTKYILN